MLLYLLLTFILMVLPVIEATPSSLASTGDSTSFYSSNGFISSPSIYSYTIENQIPSNQTTTVYKAQSLHHNTQLQQKPQLPAKLLDTINRNLYYTSLNSNSNKNVLGSSRKVAGLPATTSTTTSSAASDSSLPPPGMDPTQPAPISDCTLDRLAVYKVVLHTYWTRELFPKHYPDWRPTAQWTKTLGE